jgi:L-glyceraldehyde 3-phosphate reductase
MHSPDYDKLSPSWFRRCGTSGLLLPAISLGFWHNFGGAGTDASGTTDDRDFHENCRRMMHTAFDLGITHFDLANNYGPPPGSAEERVGRILRQDFASHRDELVIATKAGYRMGPGPYGEWGSRKYLLTSLDASLRRLQLDYVDIFYHHRPDPNTPLEETLGALHHAVQSGKALYAGLSNYSGEQTARAAEICRRSGWSRLLVHQPSYSMLNRWIEPDLLPVTDELGMGVVCFSPLAQGQLSDKYLAGIPKNSRAGSSDGFLRPEHITDATMRKVRALGTVAQERGQSLAQMALSWVLRTPRVTSALIGASTPEQIRENVQAADKVTFGAEELQQIERILGGEHA